MLLAPLLAGLLLGANPVPLAQRDPTALPVPFDRWFTTDAFGRTITFYLSRTQAKGPLPLVVFVQGSGNFSHFTEYQKHIVGGIQMMLLHQVGARARILVVEKPGVRFLELPRTPGTAEEASAEFRREDTLPRWAEAIHAAIRAARTLPDVDTTRTVVVGHSEGGHVVGRVALIDPQVTHVACLSTSGPTQLFDLIELARQGRWGDSKRAVGSILEEWSKIQKDPDNPDKFFAGHTYRHWSSYIRNTLRDDLLRVKARIYLAQGTNDVAVPVASFDVLYAELLAQGKDVTAERVEGADHGFFKSGENAGPRKSLGPPTGLDKVLAHVLDWALSNREP